MKRSLVIAAAVAALLVVVLVLAMGRKKSVDVTKPPAGINVAGDFKASQVQAGQQWPDAADVCKSKFAAPYTNGLVTSSCAQGSDPSLVNGGNIRCQPPDRSGTSGCVQARRALTA